MNEYIALRRALNHLEFMRKEFELPAFFIKDLRRQGLKAGERLALSAWEVSVEKDNSNYLWTLRRRVREIMDEISEYRQKSQERNDRIGKRISQICDSVKLKANRCFSNNEGLTYDITVESVSFRNSWFSGPWVHIEKSTRLASRDWKVRCGLHKSWYDRVGSKGNHCFMVGGHKVFTINAVPVPHNFKGVDMERITVFGKRSKAALDREHHRLHNLIDEIPEDERHDPELNEYFHDLVAELSHIDGASIEDRPTVHNLYLCTSQDQTDLDGNHLKGVGSTPEQAFKLMERRVRDTFVKELAI